ncbi:MAG TPA: hypothetical protein VMV69_13235 [Pirellulales bacterium]|nr:hypothetical protein [Pirellulales bacterium]
MPYVGPPLALVARLLVRPGEPSAGHKFRVDLTAPNGERSPMSEDLELNAKRSGLNPEGPAGANIVANLIVGFREPGAYQFHLVVDGAETLALAFFVKAPASNGPIAEARPSVEGDVYGGDAASVMEADLEDAADLEELKRLVPSNARLLALAAKRSPPPEWFEHEEESPF